MRIQLSVLVLSLTLAACGHSAPVSTGGPGPSPTPGPSATPGPTEPPTAADACNAEDWCAGAAKVVVTPTQEEIDGITEERLYVGSKTQQFNLGGFGINPLQNLPNPFADLGTSLTQPAQEPVYFSERHQETENTFIRVTVLSQGETRIVFVSLDAVGAGNLIQKGLRTAIVDASCALDWCVDAEHIVFGQTHSHAGADLQGLWGGVPVQWIEQQLYAGAAQAATTAITYRQRANATIANGETHDYNNYRRPRVTVDADADAHMALLRFENARTRRPIAQILQYAAHPTSINEDPRVPHADYIHGAMGLLEREGGIGMYYNGPIADASGSGGACPFEEPNPYDSVRCRGEAIAGFAMAQAARPLPPMLAIRNAHVTLPVTNPAFLALAPVGAFNRYYNFTPEQLTNIPGLGDVLGNVQTEIGQVPTVAQSLVTRVSLGGAGGVEIATIPGEATNTFGNFIRQVAEAANPGATTMLFGLTQNSFGYIIPEEEFSYVDASGNTGLLVPFTGYEEFVSLGPLTAPLLRIQAYIPLFDADPLTYLPDYLQACLAPGISSTDCLIADIARNLEYVQTSFANNCLEAGAPEAFCQLLDPQTPLQELCRSLGQLPEEFCDLLGDAEPVEGAAP
ncbi:MAG: hypothetical protein M3O62_15800 [Pseudomonadota bacterium]|nr:hypothetical protein [Pseudomonadota bacterium]